MLMNAGFVRERIFTNDGFVARNGHAGDLRHQAARWKEPGRMNPGMHSQNILAGLDRHCHFLERAIACAFADAVDRAFDLACAGAYGGQAVCDRHPQVVVAVSGEHGLADIADVACEVRKDFVQFVGYRIANGVRDIDRRGAGVDGGFNHLREKLELGARCVLR